MNYDLEPMFAQAIELTDASRRGVFLDEACEGNVGLRNRLNRLLLANQHAELFMSEPATIFKLSNGMIDDEHTPIGEQAGDRVGRYRLLERIGEGGMGTVFMAEQQEPVHRKVALKIVKPGLDTKEVIARFEAERQALALMNHQNIARVLDVGATAGGRPYFVMELVKGVAITEYCNEVKLTYEQRLELFVSVCDAIQHAHHKGIIHRDIKPRNVMVTQIDGKPVPKVIDFGIAKAIDHRLTEKTLFTRHGDFIGTPAYMSPEQAQHSGIDIDTRTDVYSLGALLYELLTGTPPFDVERMKTMGHDEIRRCICEEIPPRPSAAISTMQGRRAMSIAESLRTTQRELRKAVVGELDWIVMRAMDKDRNRRYETANALTCDIQRYLNNVPIVARPPTLAYQGRKFVIRNRPAVAAATAIAGMLVLSTCLSGWWAWQATVANQESNRLFNLEKEARRQAYQKTTEANELRQVAAIEAASLQEVIDFINQDLLSQADPLEEPNRNIRLRTVLDHAARRVNSQKFTLPTVEAAIRTTIGETYRGLGEYGLALLHLKRARELYQREFGDRHQKSLNANNKVIGVLLHQSKYVEAEAVLNATLPKAFEELGEKHEITLEAINLNAWRLEATGDLEQAEKILAKTLQHRLDTVGPNDSGTFKAMANLAFVYQSQRRYDEALHLLEKANEGLWHRDGQWHPDALRIISSLASLYVAREEIDKAEQLYETVIARAEISLGMEHGQTLTIKHGLALIRLSREQYTEAEVLFYAVLEGQLKQLGSTHTSTLTTMHNLALLHKSQGRFDQAESLLKSELQGRHETFGATHATTLDATTTLAFLYLDQTRFADAIPYYEQAVSLLDQTKTDDANSIVITMMLGLCQHKHGDDSAARSTLSQALQRCEDSLPDYWLRFVVESLLGEVLLELDQYDLAEDALLRGYAGLKLHEADVPSRWQPLGLRAAARRLIAFYESARSEEQKARAEEYRVELKTLHTNLDAETSAVQLESKTENNEDGYSN